MTAHMHSEFVDGCYRCDLNKDEMGSPLDYLRDVFAHGENVVGGKVDLTGLGESSAEFDRVLAEHDREVAAKALRDAADAAKHPENAPYQVWALSSQWMRDRADRIERDA